MIDAEVGELWQYHVIQGCLSDPKCPVLKLIRKLVEERTDKISILSGATTDWMYDECRSDALLEFNIPEEEWPSR